MTERQALNLLMEAKGDFLAASAHEGHCSGGRGLVLVESTTLAYLPLEIVRNLPPPLRRRALPLVRNYDPGRELVVALLVELPAPRQVMSAIGKCRPQRSPEDCFLRLCGTPDMPPFQTLPFPVPGVEQTA